MLTEIAFDCETHLIAPGLLAPPLVCLSWADDGGHGLYHRSDPSLVMNVHAMLEGYDLIVGANTPFDAAVVAAFEPELLPAIFQAYEDGRVLDVQLNQKLFDIARGQFEGYRDQHGNYHKRGYSLAELVRRHTGKDRSAEKSDPNGWRMRYSELHDVALHDWPIEAKTYAIEDSIDTLEVHRKIGVPTDAAPKARAFFALHLLSCWGIMTDAHAIDLLEGATAERFAALTKELQGFGLVRANGTRDTIKAKKRLIDACRANGIPVPLTDTGIKAAREVAKITKEAQVDARLSDEDVLEILGTARDEIEQKYASVDADACELSGDPVLEKYAERTSLQTIVDTHLVDLRKGLITPIQSRWDIAETGRIRCSKGRGGSSNGFQLTNPARAIMIPCPECHGDGCPACDDKGEIEGPGIRDCFVARPGFVYVDADFTGLELCTVAQACKILVGRSKLGDQINAGVDPHLAFGAKLAGISYAEAVERKHERQIKFFRQLAKVANFGFPGGLGAAGFVAFARGYGVKVSIDRAKELRAEWLAEYDEFVDYFALIRDMTIDGCAPSIEQLFSGRVRGLVPYTAACNGFFQGLGADGALAALWDVTRACYDPALDSILLGSRVVNFVHDQLITEVPEEFGHECALEVGRLMVEACNRYLPDVPVSCEPALSKSWRKGTEAVCQGGRLVPWDIAKEGRWSCTYANGKAVVW